MKSPDSPIRKAAILVASLDQAAADAMLDLLPPDEARRVRQSVVDLGRIDPRERRLVLEEFYRAESQSQPRQNRTAGVELDGSLARKLGMAPALAASGRPAASNRADSRPFQFLEEAEGEKLARVLVGERPQTVALVLSHLPPEQAGSVLARLSTDLRIDVIRRLVDLEETDPEVLRDVERALQSRLSQQVHMQRRRVAGLQAVAGILDASDQRVAEQILDGLAAHDPALAERLGDPPVMQFDDLVKLDDAALGAVFRAAEPEVAMTALVGAAPELVERILRRFASPEAKIVRQKLDHPGPIRLSDVEDARRQIADLARRLARQRRSRLTRQPSPAAA